MKSNSASIALLAVPVLAAYIICAQPTIAYISIWTVLQWLPINANISGNYWERMHCVLLEKILEEKRKSRSDSHAEVQIPTVDVQKHRQNLLQHLENNYGNDWRRRPVLFKGLWTKDELQQNSDGTPRMLSLDNLLKMDLQIPYFTNASVRALIPDHHGSVGDIVRNITMGKPHKIGTQLILEKYPGLIREVAPLDVVNDLFGKYFTSDQIKSSGPWNLFPATTTVPVFIAKHGDGTTISQPGTSSSDSSTRSNYPTAKLKPNQNQPFTSLHCEPIGNIAVQLSGQKKWTLVQPEYSFHIKPGISPDGRAFFASWASESDCESVPTYNAITAAGDAIWVPTWTWHRVDYIESKDIAIGGSLFHFRLIDFFENNALFSVLIIPAMLKELLGFNTQ